MRLTSRTYRSTPGRLLTLAGSLAVFMSLTAAPALAQGPGLPRTYQIQRIDSPAPVLSGTFGLQTAPIGDVNSDGEVDFATNQTEGTPNAEGQVWIYSGETGGLLGTFTAPDAGNPGNAQNNNRALVDRWMDTLGDIGSCPANTGAGQTCTSATIGGPDGAPEFFLGAEGVDVAGVRDVGRVYVIDGRTFSVLKRIDMPPGDRALVQQRQIDFPLPATNVRGGFGRTAVTPRGLPVCNGNFGVVACPSTTAIPAGVRIGDTDGGGQPDVVIGANRFTEIPSTAQPNSHCAQAAPGTICHDAGRAYIYRGEEIAGSNPAEILDGAGAGETAPKIIRNLGAQSDANDTTFTRSEIFSHAQMPIGDVGACRTGGSFPAVNPGDRCTTAARTNVPDGRPEMIISAHRADAPIFNPDPSRYEEGFSFLVDGATGTFLHIYHHPEPLPNSLFGYTTRQSFPIGDLFGTPLPDLVHAGWQNYQGKAAAGRLYLLNGDVNNAFPVFGTLDDPTPTTNERFGVARESVGDLVPSSPGGELLVGNFPSNQGLPDALTDMHFVNALSGQELQRISDPDQQLSSQFGYQVTPLGDVNEDGFLDFATSAPLWDSPGSGGSAGITNQGRIYIYRSDNSPAPGGGGGGGGGGNQGNYPPPPGGACPAGTSSGVSCARSGSGLRITGTAGNDRIVGTSGNDVIACGPGSDTVNGGPGDDVIACGPGNDTLSGGAGNDSLDGEAGNDRASGDAGLDRVLGGSGNDRLSGNSGNDNLNGGDASDRISGNSGNDRLHGGRTGNDSLDGDSGDDVLIGGVGRDSLVAGIGRDRLFGGRGNDRLNTRDRRPRDLANCGPNRDRAAVDRGDRARGCERVRRRR